MSPEQALRAKQLVSELSLLLSTVEAPIQPPSKPSAWMTTAQIAEHLSLSVTTIRAMAKRGMPHVRYGSILRFNPTICTAWLEEQR